MKAALVEFYTWHDECLYSQILFLHASGCEILLVADMRKKEDITAWLPEYCTAFYFDFSKISSFRLLRMLLKRENVEKIIINTAQGNRTLKFCLLPSIRGVEYVGNLHNTEKLATSFGQKIICKKIRKFYLLADYLLPNMQIYSKLKFAVYYAAFLPKINDANIIKPQGEMWIAIPGNIETKRRDYQYLLQLGNAIKQQSKQKRVKFIILGNASKADGPKFVNNIREQSLDDCFLTFNKFVETELFAAYLEQSDAIMPLIHPNVDSAEKYTKYKISGAFNMALVSGKTMLCHAMFQGVTGFDYPAQFYSSIDELMEQITNLQLCDTNTASQVDFEKNRKAYISLLEQ